MVRDAGWERGPPWGGHSHPLDHMHTYSFILLSNQITMQKQGEKSRATLPRTNLFPPRRRDNHESSCVSCHWDFLGMLWSWYHLWYHNLQHQPSLGSAWPLSICVVGLRKLQLSSKTLLCCIFWLGGMINSECQNVPRGWGINSREMNVVRLAII